MKKTEIFGFFAALFACAPNTSGAAYPVYNGYNGQANLGYQMPNGVQQNMVRQMPTNVGVMPNNGNVMYVPTVNGGMIAVNPAVATGSTRVTGALPRVGSSAVNAGRRYYQPQDFDRLADSGLYIGLSAAYTLSVMGEFTADYSGEATAYMVPGAFQGGAFKKDTVLPLQLSLGAAINSDLRIDFSYTRYTDLSYPQSVQTSDGQGGFVTANATGGAVTSNVALINMFYNIDSYTGYLAGGSLRPYIGLGVGVALNTTSDYTVLDSTFYSENDPSYVGPGEPTGVSDINAYHNGGTNEQLAFELEGGVTTELGNGMKLDLFVRYMYMGKVKSSGSIVLTQNEWIGDGAGGESDYQTVAHYTDWTESATLSTVDLGARLRLQF